MRFPTLDAWNATVQRALTPSLTLTLAYVGNKGTHTLTDGDGNTTNPQEEAISLPGSFSVNGQTQTWDPAGQIGGTANPLFLQRYYGGKLAACADPAYISPGGTGVLPGECGWTQGISDYSSAQNTHFNAIQVTLAQATWHGLNANFNYQFAHASDTAGGYATWDKAVANGNDSDVRHHSASLYGSYSLPVGKGKQFLTNANHLTDLIVGGYELSGTSNLSSGLPFSLGIDCVFQPVANGPKYADLPNGPNTGAPCYPNVTQRLKTNLSSFTPGAGWKFYNTQQAKPNDDIDMINGFSDPGLDKIGNGGRNNYFGPSFFNTDLSIQKSFNIWEHVDTKFRMDAINAVNHINPGNPGGYILGDPTTSNPGAITGEAPGPGPRQLEFSLKVTF
jgi:hypothetical protein